MYNSFIHNLAAGFVKQAKDAGASEDFINGVISYSVDMQKEAFIKFAQMDPVQKIACYTDLVDEFKYNPKARELINKVAADLEFHKAADLQTMINDGMAGIGKGWDRVKAEAAPIVDKAKQSLGGAAPTTTGAAPAAGNADGTSMLGGIGGGIGGLLLALALGGTDNPLAMLLLPALLGGAGYFAPGLYDKYKNWSDDNATKGRAKSFGEMADKTNKMNSELAANATGPVSKTPDFDTSFSLDQGRNDAAQLQGGTPLEPLQGTDTTRGTVAFPSSGNPEGFQPNTNLEKQVALPGLGSTGVAYGDNLPLKAPAADNFVEMNKNIDNDGGIAESLAHEQALEDARTQIANQESSIPILRSPQVQELRQNLETGMDIPAHPIKTLSGLISGDFVPAGNEVVQRNINSQVAKNMGTNPEYVDAMNKRNYGKANSVWANARNSALGPFQQAIKRQQQINMDNSLATKTFNKVMPTAQKFYNKAKPFIPEKPTQPGHYGLPNG